MMEIRAAIIDDLTAVVRMLADDFLGQQRGLFEVPVPDSYVRAFNEIDSDPDNELIVAALNGQILGTLQLTFAPSISHQGGKRCTVESVRVDEKFRGRGIGRKLMLLAIERAREKGCISMSLTTHRDRGDAHRFYESLGFSKSHIGIKLKL